MASPRQLAHSPLARLLARVLILALVAGLLPADARASAPTSPAAPGSHALPDLAAAVPATAGEVLFCVVVVVADPIWLTKTAFGELLAHTGSDPQPYAFAGEPYDPNVGFQYHRARWMDPRIGRFVGRDAWEGNVFDPPTLHRYLYAVDNAVNDRDPSGNQNLGEMAAVVAVIGSLYAAFRGLSTAIAGGTRAQVARAEAEGFLIGAAVAATVYGVIWAGTIAYIGLATGGLTFSPQIYSSYRAGHAYVVTLETTTTVYRYTAYPPNGMTPVTGQWWTTTLYPSASQAIGELALPASNTAHYVYSGVIPTGTQILIGGVASQFGNLGGGVQIYLSNPLIMSYLGTIP